MLSCCFLSLLCFSWTKNVSYLQAAANLNKMMKMCNFVLFKLYNFEKIILTRYEDHKLLLKYGPSAWGIISKECPLCNSLIFNLENEHQVALSAIQNEKFSLVWSCVIQNLNCISHHISKFKLFESSHLMKSVIFSDFLQPASHPHQTHLLQFIQPLCLSSACWEEKHLIMCFPLFQ